MSDSFVTPWTLAHKASLSMGFSKQEYWSRLSFLSPGDLPNPGVEPGPPAFQADALTSELPGKPRTSKVLCITRGRYRVNGWGNEWMNQENERKKEI